VAADTLTELTVARATTYVMSCDASVVVTFDPGSIDGDEIVQSAIDRLGDLEQRWSRFLPSSEISELNATAGTLRRVSPDTFRLIEALVQAWHATDGAFDPTLLGAIVHLGYGVSRDRVDHRTSLAPATELRGRPARILVRAADLAVMLPPGTTLDAGGLGKGLAADLVADELIARGARGALVEIGGDLRVRGCAPSGPAWPISIVDTGDVVELADGGVATSTSRLRTWTTRGAEHHHLVDPSTLRSTNNEVAACTVIAGTGAWAEAFTKIAFARGVTRALAHYESSGLAAAITTSDGVVTTSAWKEFRR
jgi:thiamine biosynthesis lipoprotein